MPAFTPDLARRFLRRVFLPLGFPSVFLFPAACGESPTDAPPEEITQLPRQLSVSETEVIEASNRFAFELAHQVTAPDSSFVLSPLSASMALGMTLNGAAEDTYDQMRATLGFGELPREEINASYRSLIELLLDLDPTVEMAVGNSIWYRTGFDVRDSFLETVRDYFDAETAALDFSDPGASERINGWVRDVTRDRIEEIVPESIDPRIVMYLINAVYFRGDWTERFDPERTADAPFHRPDGSTVTVPMMEKRFDEISYHRRPDVQAVDLPYGGGAFSMTVLLPDSDRDVESWLRSLDEAGWDELVDALDGSGTELWLHLPRFETTYERTLNDDLIALGMTDAFDRHAADFSQIISDEQIWIDDVLQQTYIRVDEEGTEAAAATSVEMRVVSAPSTLRIDRPFVFAIRERLSGTILFLGKVVDPTA